MNILRQTMSFVTHNIARVTQLSVISNPSVIGTQILRKSPVSLVSLLMRSMSTLNQMHRSGPHFKKRPNRQVRFSLRKSFILRFNIFFLPASRWKAFCQRSCSQNSRKKAKKAQFSK